MNLPRDFAAIAAERDRLRLEVNGLLVENANLRGVRDQLLKDDGETIERLRAALKRYGRHTVSCPATGIFSPPEGAPYCTCGFEAITAEPQTEKQP